MVKRHPNQKSVQVAAEDRKRTEQILKSFSEDSTPLIPILQKMQNEYGYLPRPVLFYLADRLQIPMSRIWGIVTFYSQFNLQPGGEHIIKVCQGTACHVRKGGNILQTIKDELNIKPQETSSNGLFTLQVVRCVGSCSLAPVIMIDDKAYGRLTPDRIPQILDSYR